MCVCVCMHLYVCVCVCVCACVCVCEKLVEVQDRIVEITQAPICIYDTSKLYGPCKWRLCNISNATWKLRVPPTMRLIVDISILYIWRPIRFCASSKHIDSNRNWECKLGSLGEAVGESRIQSPWSWYYMRSTRTTPSRRVLGKR